jgi:hypothetical protein
MPRGKTAVKKGRTSPKVEKSQDDLMKELVDKVKKLNESETFDKYIQLNEQGKKVGPGITLAGLSRIYKSPENTDFIFVNEFRIAGPSSAVDKVLIQLGSSVASQRLKNGLIDATNYESHVVERVAPPKEDKVEPVYTLDKIADLAKRLKITRGPQKGGEEDTLKKKKASRSKTNTGVQVKQTPQIPVDKIPASLEAIEDLLKRLAEKQLGLDVSVASLQEGFVLGCKVFRVSSKSKKIPIPYKNGHLTGETRTSLELFLTGLGHQASEISALLKGLPKPETKKEETVLKPKKKPAKEEKPVEVSKAKTRAVKPRTSNE